MSGHFPSSHAAHRDNQIGALVVVILAVFGVLLKKRYVDTLLHL